MIKTSILCLLAVLLAAAAIPAMSAGSFSDAPMASIVVAASNTPAKLKAKADLVCDGKHDEVELLKSITAASKYDVQMDINPAKQVTVKCYGKHSVLWLPGDYYLDSTLVIPDAADCVINAEGSYFNYRPATGDAVLIKGAYRCRYHFGTIETKSTGAAIHVQPARGMLNGMNLISFTGMVGHDLKGTGLLLDPSVNNVCCNKFEGTDISGFDVGVMVSDAAVPTADNPGSGKCDTNWYWFVFIRRCNTCIWEKQRGVDSGVWNVNVDASTPNSTAIRTGAIYGKWFIHLGIWAKYFDGSPCKGIVLDPGARENTFESPLPRRFWWPYSEDNSGNKTNTFISPP